MTKVWEFIKKWAWAIILGLVTLLAAGRKPLWVRRKEEEIKARDKEITKAQEDAEDVYSTYEEVKADHDESIKQAQQKQSKPGFNNADDAASFLDDILGKRK